MIALSVAVALLFIALFLLAGATIEMYRDLHQIQDELGLLDKPWPLAMKEEGLRPSDVGLAAELDDAEFAVVLFITDRCMTCRSLLASLAGRMPDTLHIVVEARTSSRAEQLLLDHGMAVGGRIVYDGDSDIAQALGLTLSPAGVVIRDGMVMRAATVPSSRQLQSLLADAPVVSTTSRGREKLTATQRRHARD